MADPAAPETAPDLDAYAAAAASVLGFAIDPAWRPAILANLRVLHAAAELVGSFPLPDEAAAAPVYEA